MNLCLDLKRKGVEVDFACSPQGVDTGKNKIVAVARENGLNPINFLSLGKHRNPLWNYLDARRLRRHLSTTPYDLVHCNLDNDHDIALDATHGLGIPLVRSNHYGTGIPATQRNRRLLSKTTALLEPSRIALEEDINAFNFIREDMYIVHGAIDTVRFNPSRSIPDMKKSIGIPANAFVLGIVARMQTHRHYEDLFEGFSKFSSQHNNTHLLVIGRGTRQEQVGFKPVREYGLEKKVHFTGYLDDDAYVGALNSFNVGIFLTPGTDGTCRAAREIMAMGKALIVADRGMLREIVESQSEGIVTDGSATQLAQAMEKFYNTPEMLVKLSEKAYEKAHSQFTLSHQSDTVIAIYESVLKKK